MTEFHAITNLYLLKCQEVAEVLQISRAQAYRLIQERKIPAIHIGRSVRVRLDDLMDYLVETRVDKE